MALTGVLGEGRQIHTATVLADGGVLVVGGFDAGDLPLASASRFDATTGKFSLTGSMATARGFHTATLLDDGHVLIAGGGPAAWNFPGLYLASAELYDPATGTFSPTGDMTVSRENHTATRLLDGRVLITGGNDYGDHAVASAEIYDPTTGKFTETGLMATARGYHSATLLDDGRVLIAGGDPANNASHSLIASAEIYDPTTGTFSPTGSMNSERSFHAATLLADGRVLITGGGDAEHDLAAAEIYDPATGTFTATGPMAAARWETAAVLLADGRVLVAGGGGDYSHRNFLDSAELFDPTSGTFSPTGSMAEARTWLQASLLADGRVLVTGGYGDLAPLASAEIYDPTTGTFSPAGLQPQAVRCAETDNATPSATVLWDEVMGPEATIKAGQAVVFVTTGYSPSVTEGTNGKPAENACIDVRIGQDVGPMKVVVTFYQPGDYNITCRKTPETMHTVVHVLP